MPSSEIYKILNQLDQLTVQTIKIEQAAHNLTAELINLQQSIANLERSTEE